jgi:glycine hydroxymethyltransferase
LEPATLDGQQAHLLAAKTSLLAEDLTRRGITLTTAGVDNHRNLIEVASSYKLTGGQAKTALLD